MTPRPIALVDRNWRPASTVPLERRLWQRVGATDAGCWEWVGAHNHGYGRIFHAGREYRVHRMVYELLVGPIPDGLQIDHLCRNTLCCNPAHLEPVTARVNTLRGRTLQAANAAKEVCHQGHPFTGDNLLIRANGARSCRECARLRNLQRHPDARRRPFTHCKRGHEFTPENTYALGDTSTRVCRQCSKENSQRQRAKRRNAGGDQ